MAAPGKLQVHEMGVFAKPGQRVPELDGIRGVAIALVLVWHYLTVPLLHSPSPVLHFIGCATIQALSGVDLFFVLSGFLIGGILPRDQNTISGPSTSGGLSEYCRSIP
jgi:peptidoglycan/LPS O-acetylase OafA/YrhL